MNKGTRSLYMGLMLGLTVLSFGQARDLNFSARNSPILTIGYSIPLGLRLGVASNIQHIVRLLFLCWFLLLCQCSSRLKNTATQYILVFWMFLIFFGLFLLLDFHWDNLTSSFPPHFDTCSSLASLNNGIFDTLTYLNSYLNSLVLAYVRFWPHQQHNQARKRIKSR